MTEHTDEVELQYEGRKIICRMKKELGNIHIALSENEYLVTDSIATIHFSGFPFE
jgi:hypothetical protein